MIRFHWMNRKLYVTTRQTIKEGDLYLDRLVHPVLVQYPLVMWGFCDKEEKIIQSHMGTTSPVSSSRRIFLTIQF